MKTRKKRIIPAVPAAMLWAVLFAVLAPSPALAHKVNVFAFVDGNTIRTESYFPDGKPCVNAKIIAQTAEGVTLLEGLTDDEGMFSFKIPQRTDIVVVLDAGMGHRGEYRIKASEIPEYIGEKKPATPAAAEPKKKTSAPKAEDKAPAAAKAEPEPEPEPEEAAEEEKVYGIPVECKDVLAPLIEEELSERLAPIVAEIKKQSQDKITVTDVVGGIGYIVGLMGIWLYFSGRRKKDSD